MINIQCVLMYSFIYTTYTNRNNVTHLAVSVCHSIIVVIMMMSLRC